MAEWHLIHDAERLGLFINLLGEDLDHLRVLDLGANPYILTHALATAGASVVAAGYPRERSSIEGCRTGYSDVVEFVDDSDCSSLAVPLARFDVESDRFPFDDGAFDALFCGELIEHLARGPDHLLHECNRVLRLGGKLVLSAPNAVSLSRLISIARGVNPEWPYSSQGIHARHNRNYTVDELRDLLQGNGFQPYAEVGITWVQPRAIYAPGPVGWAKWLVLAGAQCIIHRRAHALRRLADGVVIAGVKSSDSQPYRPHWLFESADSVPMLAQGTGRAHADA